MKLQVTQENFNRALSSVARIATTRATLPILSNVLLRTVNNRLQVIATNLDIAVTHFIGGKISKEGSITIPARLTQDFVSNLPTGVIDLELEGNKLHINSGLYTSTINGTNTEEFPVMPAIEIGKSFTIDSQKLKNGLSQVVIGASNDEARPVLTGVYFNTYKDKLYVVATDSYRLAEKALVDTKESIKLLVPANAVSELLRISGDYQGETVVTYDDQQVRFQVGDVELVARLLEGKYPDYRQLIPKAFNVSFSIDTTELNNITKVSALFARENAGSITINVDGDKQEVSIHSIATQLGENTASAKAKVEGSGSVTLNSRYLLEALHVLDNDKAKVGFNGKLEPVVISSATNKTDYIHIIMPLKS